MRGVLITGTDTGVGKTVVGVVIEPSRILAAFEEIALRRDFVIVEGAGGLLVPLAGCYTFADLARDLRLSLLVVVGSKLGALNHALLMLFCAQARSLSVVGYILNHPTALDDIAIRTKACALAHLTDVPCLGTLLFLSLSGKIEGLSVSALFLPLVFLLRSISLRRWGRRRDRLEHATNCEP